MYAAGWWWAARRWVSRAAHAASSLGGAARGTRRGAGCGAGRGAGRGAAAACARVSPREGALLRRARALHHGGHRRERHLFHLNETFENNFVLLENIFLLLIIIYQCIIFLSWLSTVYTMDWYI